MAYLYAMDQDALKSFLAAIYPLTPAELDAVTADWQLLTCKRKTLRPLKGLFEG